MFTKYKYWIMALVVIIIAACVFFFWPAPAEAYQVETGDSVKLTSASGTTGYEAGNFGVYDSDGYYIFDTFCLEENVTFSPGTYYNVTVDPTLLPNGSIIENETRYLYGAFLNDELDTYSGTNANINDMQNAIWAYQGDYTLTGNEFFDLAAGFTGDPLDYSVAAMNLWDANGKAYQSQLVGNYKEGGAPPAPVPEPATVMLMGMGLVMVGLRKKWHKKSS